MGKSESHSELLLEEDEILKEVCDESDLAVRFVFFFRQTSVRGSSEFLTRHAAGSSGQERGLQARCPADEPACRYLGNPHRFDRNAKHTVHTQASVRS